MKLNSWLYAAVVSIAAAGCGVDHGDDAAETPSKVAGSAGQAGQTNAGGQAGSSGATQTEKVCDPGIYARTPCCADGSEGRQRCNDTGTAWGACECDSSGTGGSSGSPSTGGSGGSANVGGSAGTGGTSGSSTGGSSNQGGSSGVGGGSTGGSAGSPSTGGSGGSSGVMCGPYHAGQIVETQCCPGGATGKQACTNEGVMSDCWDCQPGAGGSSGTGGSSGAGGTSTGGSSGSSSTGGSSGIGGNSGVGGSGGSPTVKCGVYDVGSIVDTYCCPGGALGKQVCQNTGIWSSCMDCSTGTGGTGGSSGSGGSSGTGGSGGSSMSHDWDHDGSYTPADCDDSNPNVRPNIPEICSNGLDDNCDGKIDEGCPIDKDNDGWPADDDCDDNDPMVNKQAAELCNGKDDNCNGLIDENCNYQTFYRDADGDGFGVESDTKQGVNAPSGYVAKKGDCDDANAAVNPGAVEVCYDGLDNDCDGTSDDGCAPVITDPILTCHYASPKPGTHTYYAFAGDDGTGSQDPMVWGGTGQPYVTSNAVWGSFTHSIKKGNEVVLNIVADPPSPDPINDWKSSDSAIRNKFWSGTVGCSTSPLGMAMNVWCELSENGVSKPTARPYAVSNGQGGCNLMVVAQPSLTLGSSDSDGDGFANANDCRPNDPSAYPGANEVQFDGIDQNCDGLYSSPRAMVTMCGVNTTYTPTLRNVTFWGNDAPMTLTNGCYQTNWLWLDVAPREFWVEWGASGNMSADNSYWGGVCHDMTTSVTLKLETGTSVNVTLQKVSGQDTCHRFASF